MAYYVISDNQCLFESMTKEEILAAITQAVSTHTISDVDTGFVTKIKEQNKNRALAFWVGSTAEYNALSPKPENTFCILTDDTDMDDLEEAIQSILARMDQYDASLDSINNEIEDITAAVEQVESDLSLAQNDISANTSWRIKEDIKRGFELLAEEITYGEQDPAVPMNTTGEYGNYTVSDFDVFQVYVDKPYGGNGSTAVACALVSNWAHGRRTEGAIMGTGVYYYNGKMNIYEINIAVNLLNNTITANMSRRIEFNVSLQSFNVQEDLTITRIVGAA